MNALGEAEEEVNYPEQLPSNPWGSFYIEINQPEVGKAHSPLIPVPRNGEDSPSCSLKCEPSP